MPSDLLSSTTTASFWTSLQEVTASLAVAQTSEDVADAILFHVVSALDTDRGYVVLLTDDGLFLRVVRSVGFPAEDAQGSEQFSVDLPVPLAEAVRCEVPVFVVGHAEKQKRYPLLAGMEFTEKNPSLLALPLTSGTKVLGAIGLAFASSRSFTADEIAFLQTVAQQCAISLERVRLFEQQARLEATIRTLTETRQRYQQLLEVSPDAVMVHEGDSIVYANRALVRLVGAESASDLIGKSPLSLDHPDSRALAKECIRYLEQEGGRKEALELNLLALDGSTIAVETTAAACEWEGRPAIQVVRRDIRERYEAERKLRESEQRFRFLAESIPHFVWSARPDGVSDYWNSAFLEFMGKTESEMQEYDWTEKIHPDDRGRTLAAWTEAHREDKEFMIEARMRRAADGEYRWFLGHALPLRDEQGNIVRWYGTCTDIHERKVAEERALRLQNMLQAILANAPAVMWIKDTERRYLLINSQAQAVMGHPESDIIGKTNEELGLCAESARVSREQDNLVLETREPHFFESNTTFDDSRRAMFASKFPIFAPDGSLYGVGAVALDITERKKLEQQYLQAQKMEGIGRLAGGIAHDFNNLLCVILGYAEMAAMELAEGSPVLESIQTIEGAATRAAALTKQLLAFARRQPTAPKVFSVNDLIQNMSEMLRPLIGEQIELSLRLEPDLGLISADPNQIEQVIVNLVVNARDAMPDGGKLLLRTDTIRLEDPVWQDVAVVPGEYVMLSVSDTGMGMTEEVRSRIFEPFFSTKGVGEGTGLGLATCYGIVKQHNGYIWVYSELGIGTTMKIYLPRADAKATGTSDEGAPTKAPQGTETILVVEDEELVRHVTVKTLRANGYAVLEAANGGEGMRVAAAHQGPIHLLMSDMVMPQMGGMELAQRLREARPSTRVLFVSGYSDQAFNAQGAPAPDVALLPKPFTLRALLTKIREVLAS